MDRVRVFLVALVLILAAGVAEWLEPVQALPPDRDRLDVRELTPARIQDWVLLPNPETMPPLQIAEEGRPYPYSSEIALTYGNAAGERVMLSIAYGRNQLDHRQHAHRPEYCYRAQGFGITTQSDERLSTEYGDLPVRRLDTQLRSRREPVTYWMTVGDEPVLPGWSRSLVQVRHALGRTVPDGILVRVSTLDPDPRHGFAVQDRFVREWLGALPAERRLWLGGRP